MKENGIIQKYIEKYPWPRRRLIRSAFSFGIDLVANLLIRWDISGRENLPEKGPLLIIGNHASFLDTVAPIHSTPWPLEFIGDFEMPNAPPLVRFFPNTWQTLKIQQGTPNFEALQASEAILAQDGVLVIYPEGHAEPGPLRRALPGAAYVALRTGVPILPMGTFSNNDWKLFKTIKERKHRLRVFTRIGRVFGPLKTNNPNRPTREELKEAGHLMMTKIAELLPEEFQGDYKNAIA